MTLKSHPEGSIFSALATLELAAMRWASHSRKLCNGIMRAFEALRRVLNKQIYFQFTMKTKIKHTRSRSDQSVNRTSFSSTRCRPVTADSCPRDARRWLHAALAIVMLSSVCRVSTAQGTWSTAQLSVARLSPAATSVGNVAIFAGGDRTSNACL